MIWLNIQLMVEVENDHPDLGRSPYFDREPILIDRVEEDLEKKILSAIKAGDYRLGAIQVLE
jgi:hypothetical protein